MLPSSRPLRLRFRQPVVACVQDADDRSFGTGCVVGYPVPLLLPVIGNRRRLRQLPPLGNELVAHLARKDPRRKRGERPG
jgi:hypothetical protein